MENKTFWFPHDSNARSDERITKLRIKHGNEGYGIYWCLVELLRDATAMRRQCDWDALAYEIRCDASLVQSIVCAFGLFTRSKSGTEFWSESLLRRQSKMLETSEKNRANAQKRWVGKNATALPPHSDRIATAMHSTVQDSTVHNKQDSTREKEADKPPRPKFIPPNFHEICDECKNEIEANKFLDYYEANGWRVGRNPLKDWKAALRNWMRRRGEFQTQKKSSASAAKLDPMQATMDSIARGDPLKNKQRYNDLLTLNTGG